MENTIPPQNQTEKAFLRRLGNRVKTKVTEEFLEYANHSSAIGKDRQDLLDREFTLNEQEFFDALDKSCALAAIALEQGRKASARIRYFNTEMDKMFQESSAIFPQAANAWILDGILFSHQLAGMKYLYGLDVQEAAVIDAFGSASSISLGAQNPYLTALDRLEDALCIRDNICSAYHIGVRQAYALKKLSNLYPGMREQPLVVHCESSGTIANAVAIESAAAYVEKKLMGGKIGAKILAVDGSWAGGYGPAREATGFGVNDCQEKRIDGSVWVDRCLPLPIKENKDSFLALLNQKIENASVAGLYIEPDILGDAGILPVDPEILQETIQLFGKNKLPIIADCVQQLGRTGSYWGENVETILKNYPYLIVTTAKSASNGQPFSYTILPKEIADCAYPLSQVTTNQFNGALLRAVAVSELLSAPELQQWLSDKANKIEETASKYGITLGTTGLRGKYLNRAVSVGSNETVKLVQIALLVEDGILVGALPESIRYQPMLLDYSSTSELVANVIFKRIAEVQRGNISKDVEWIHNKMKNVPSGLAR